MTLTLVVMGGEGHGQVEDGICCMHLKICDIAFDLAASSDGVAAKESGQQHPPITRPPKTASFVKQCGDTIRMIPSFPEPAPAQGI
jgi:hypothetical protein